MTNSHDYLAVILIGGGSSWGRSPDKEEAIRRAIANYRDWDVYYKVANTEVIINRPATVELTCATIVNRIPDLIAAAPGFTTTEKMPTNAFRARGLSFYVK